MQFLWPWLAVAYSKYRKAYRGIQKYSVGMEKAIGETKVMIFPAGLVAK